MRSRNLVRPIDGLNRGMSLCYYSLGRGRREKKRGNPGNSFRNITDNFTLRDLPFSLKSRELLVTSNLA